MLRGDNSDTSMKLKWVLCVSHATFLSLGYLSMSHYHHVMHHLYACLSIIMHHFYLSQSQYHIMQCIISLLISVNLSIILHHF